jgi:hypothetical protein
MSVGRILAWGTLAAVVYSMIYFRGDAQRYLKMKNM